VEDDSKSHLLYDSTEPRPRRRHLASFGASIAAHAAIVALIVCFATPLSRGHSEWVLAYLVEGADGVSGRGGANTAAGGTPAAVAVVSLRSAPPKAARKPRRRLSSASAADESVAPAHDAPAASQGDAAGARLAAVSGNGGAGGAAHTGAAAGGTAGTAGDPNSVAHADYASNPPPIYPALARRREQQGTVTVRVLVGADGSVERAEIADSSGFDTLDDAALETVRSRWRFVPARHDGLAVESWVLVPIRFALLEANVVR